MFHEWKTVRNHVKRVLAQVPMFVMRFTPEPLLDGMQVLGGRGHDDHLRFELRH